ncbi:MAG: hypothetical protein K9G46_05625 [Flavobacteriales bacterium]|nr:hypothetical protein [Flavobacteriales bacterium]
MTTIIGGHDSHGRAVRSSISITDSPTDYQKFMFGEKLRPFVPQGGKRMVRGLPLTSLKNVTSHKKW